MARKSGSDGGGNGGSGGGKGAGAPLKLTPTAREVNLAKRRAREQRAEMFVDFFRGAAPYIKAHQGKTFVIYFGGVTVRSSKFAEVMQDVAVMHALGIRVVLVHGARPQIDDRIRLRGGEPRFEGERRVTDATALEAVKDAVGSVRVQVEATLSMGVSVAEKGGERIRVASGNFVIAQPIGIVDGVDHLYAGRVRKIDVDGIRQRLDAGAVVLLSPLGGSITGEAFNVGSHEVSSAAAVALKADKLISVIEGRGLADDDRHLISELTPDAAAKLLHRRRKSLGGEAGMALQAAIAACRGGVRRAHIVGHGVEGGLLRELFSREGAGTLVTSEVFEGMRAATVNDVPGIIALIRPLEEAGILAARSRELLEQEVDRFVVIERDGMIIGCAALHVFPRAKCAEVACVAVHPAYREEGRGEELMTVLEKRAKSMGLRRVFVLTTQTAHWFLERGFRPRPLSELPEERKKRYTPERGSKVFFLDL